MIHIADIIMILLKSAPDHGRSKNSAVTIWKQSCCSSAVQVVSVVVMANGFSWKIEKKKKKPQKEPYIFI